MNKIIRAFLFLFTIILVSCGQDRSGEYYAVVKDKKWIEETMREVYLWNEDIPDENDLNYLTTPTSFFASLLTRTGFNNGADKFSAIEILEEESTRAFLSNYPISYGMQCRLYQSNKSTRYYYALVLYVLPDSPAYKAGIKRGDWIGKIDGNQIEKGDEELLYTGGNVTLELSTIEITYKNEEDEEDKEEEDTTEEDNEDKEEEREIESYEWVTFKEVELSAAINVPQTPYITETILHDTEIGNIGYLVYTNFSLGPGNESTDTQYVDEMLQIFTRFKNGNLQKFILDLRYNPGGYLHCAHVLATLLAPEESLGEKFCSIIHNEHQTAQNQDLYLNTSLTQGINLNLKELYVITSEETASASEVLINCLTPYMQITTIGKTTVGKNVASQEYYTDEFPLIRLLPIVAYVKDANNEIKYVGIDPDFEVAELPAVTNEIYPLGDPQENLLYNTIYIIKNGRLPGTEEEEVVEAATSKRRLNKLEGILLKK